MVHIANLVSKHGKITHVDVAGSYGLRGLTEQRPMHAFICSTEEGFSPLGAERSFLCDMLGVPWEEICSLAHWNHSENQEVSLILVPSRIPDSEFRGLILAASERSRCYSTFALPSYGKIYRDFFYNVTYEAIAASCQRWAATRLAISHLTGCGTERRRDADALVCNLEALAHYCDDHEKANIECLCYVGCCVRRDNFRNLPELTRRFGTTHRPIEIASRMRHGYEVLDLYW